MPLREGETFSPSAQGIIEFEVGSYSLDTIEVENGKEFEHLLRLDGIGEFVIPKAIIDSIENIPMSQKITSEQMGKALLNKMLELAYQKVWSPAPIS